jgi:uncharacterized protein (TIGR02996 family)
MSDEAGFLKSIADQPAERSTRLVYADWLDEQGRPREASFLRLQIQAAELHAKLLELGGQLEPTWLTAVGDVRTGSNEFELRSGRAVGLLEIRQFGVYAGLLEGLPTREMNRRHINRLVGEETRGENRPYVIEPPARPIQYENTRPYPFGIPEEIPAVACVGSFTSSGGARDKGRDGSALTIIWFQHAFAFPVDPGVREQIRAIDWDRHAHDFDW